jgi:hypothetical protein
MSTHALTTQSTLMAALASAHQILQGTMSDVDDELANRSAPGNANPIGAAYAHVVLSEDAIVNRWFKSQSPLCAGSWAGRTGTDRPMPMHGVVEGNLGDWYHSVQVDMAALNQYAQAVFANSEEFIGSADDEMLAREIDTPMGQMPLASVFEVFVIGHCNNMSGEISAIKGAFGRKGYPF